MLVPLAAGVHLFPFRTESLSPPAPMVLGQMSRESRSVPTQINRPPLHTQRGLCCFSHLLSYLCTMSKNYKYVCIHGHFYQPPRENAWLETVERQESAHPFHDWNSRINFECYAPNAAARILDETGWIPESEITITASLSTSAPRCSVGLPKMTPKPTRSS